jgi:2,3-dihydroxyphenylpropionate 1,2-dioxygenase
MSHTPLLERNRPQADVERRFNAAVTQTSQKIADWAPDLCVLFFPDHFNGFFYDLMPSFCIGARGRSIGDYGTTPGTLRIPEDLALDCARACLADGVDVTISYRMTVDHGAAQPLELLSEVTEVASVVPIFINCAAAPRPTFARVQALGAAIGRWASARQERILIIGSGGLSHDPPIPDMATASPEVQAELIDGRNADHAARVARQNRVIGLGRAFVAGETPIRPIHPEWDNDFLQALLRGDTRICDQWTDDEITRQAGRGGHEVRTWIAGFSALQANGGYSAELAFYDPIKEWITGTAVATAKPLRAA